MNTRLISLYACNYALYAGLAFAAAGAAKGAAPKVEEPATVPPLPPATVAPAVPLPPTETPVVVEEKPVAAKVKPELTGVASGIAMPTKAIGRSVGAQNIYDFDGLANVGDSFGIKNKSASQIASTITGANKRYRVQKKDEAGNVVMTAVQEIKDASGNVIGHTKPEPVMIAGKTFKAFDVDPATDPAGAKCRVWRTQ